MALCPQPLVQPVTVVLIDRQRLFARGLEVLLDDLSGGRMLVVARGDDAGEAAALVRRHRPRLAIVDLDLGTPGGLAAIRAARRQDPGIRVAALAADDDHEQAAEALRAGAGGVLFRSADPEALVPPLLALAGGMSVVPSPLLGRILGSSPPATPTILDRFSAQDLQLWRLVADGEETAEISRRLCVSPRTAKRMIALLLRRIGVAKRVQAAALAGHLGLLEHPGRSEPPAGLEGRPPGRPGLRGPNQPPGPRTPW